MVDQGVAVIFAYSVQCFQSPSQPKHIIFETKDFSKDKHTLDRLPTWGDFHKLGTKFL